MNPSACPAARLSEVDRKDLAVHALAGTTTVTDLSGQHGVSRKFVYQQASFCRVVRRDKEFPVLTMAAV